MGKALTEEDAAELERCLAGGGVAIFPVDTVYGLGCNPESARAVGKLYEVKGRPAEQPAAVMFFDLARAFAALPVLGPATEAAVRVLLPGSVTLILPNPEQLFPLACGPEPGKLGLRVPQLGAAISALAAVRQPVLQSSANRSGEPPAASVADIADSVRARADLVLDAGRLPGIASTVIDLTTYEEAGGFTVVRRGAMPEAEVADRLEGTR